MVSGSAETPITRSLPSDRLKLMPKRTTLKNVMVDKDAFEAIMRKLIASPPIRKDDLKPKRKAAKKRAPKPS